MEKLPDSHFDVHSGSSADSSRGSPISREVARYYEQTTIPSLAFTIDSFYDVIFVFNLATKKISVFNTVVTEIAKEKEGRSLFVQDIALTTKYESTVTRYNAALNILACLDILSSSQSNM